MAIKAEKNATTGFQKETETDVFMPYKVFRGLQKLEVEFLSAILSPTEGHAHDLCSAMES